MVACGTNLLGGTEPECLEAVSVGQACEAAQSRRWYYNEAVGQCLGFIYLGCGGGRNNFRSPQECAAACTPANGTAPSRLRARDADANALLYIPPPSHSSDRWPILRSQLSYQPHFQFPIRSLVNPGNNIEVRHILFPVSKILISIPKTMIHNLIM